jgi:hypothetical protein
MDYWDAIFLIWPGNVHGPILEVALVINLSLTGYGKSFWGLLLFS